MVVVVVTAVCVWRWSGMLCGGVMGTEVVFGRTAAAAAMLD